MSQTVDMMLIDRLAKEHADARGALDEIRAEILEAITRIKRQHHPRLKGLAALVVQTHDALAAAIDDGRELFEKPKTRVMHGIKFGLRKGSDTCEYDKAAVVAAIKDRLPDKAYLLIEVKESPVAMAIRQLTLDEMAAIGARIVPGIDEVSIKSVDSGIDKWIEAIVKAADKEAEPA